MARLAGYYATGDAGTRVPEILCQFLGVAHHICPNGRGVDGAALDLEYQRIELIKFNLHDNSGTYREYVAGRDGKPGSALKVWEAMRLPPEHPRYADVGGDGEQVCSGDLIRHRNLTGICNDLKNPLIGSTGQPSPATSSSRPPFRGSARTSSPATATAAGWGF